MAEEPTTAFLLSLLAGIFIFLGTLYGVLSTIFIESFLSRIGFSEILRLPQFNPVYIMAVAAWDIFCGALTILGSIWIRSGEKRNVKKGSTLVLIFSLLSFIGAGGGLLIGFALGLAGSIVGLTWKPETK